MILTTQLAFERRAAIPGHLRPLPHCFDDPKKRIYDDRLVAMGQLDEVVRLLQQNQLIVAKTITGDPAAAALRGQDTKLATDILQGPMSQAFVPVRDSINALIQLQLDVAKSEFTQSQNTFHTVRARSLPATWIFPIARKSRPARWKKPHRRWRN